MDNLRAFIEARLADDEAIAQAITGKEWHEGSAWLTDMIHPLQSQLIDRPHFVPMITEEDIRHIARHDPARVLREVAAKREVMAWIFHYEAKIDGEWGDCHSAEDIAAGRCPYTSVDGIEALRVLASVWSDHPDYLTEWSPENVVPAV